MFRTSAYRWSTSTSFQLSSVTGNAYFRATPPRPPRGLPARDRELRAELGQGGLELLRLLPLLLRARREVARERHGRVLQGGLRDDLDEPLLVELLHRRVDARARHAGDRGDLGRRRVPQVQEGEVHAGL